MTQSQQKLFRFYRSNLATVVWNPEKDKPLATFVKGQFYTKDPVVAQKLTEMGYPQVSLDANTPPDILFEKGEILEGNVPIMPKGMNEEAVLAKQKQEAEQEKLATQSKKDEDLSPAMLTLQAQEGDDKDETEQTVIKPKPKKKAKPKAPRKSTGTKKIKRRKK
jgi:hypothetical protein